MTRSWLAVAVATSVGAAIAHGDCAAQTGRGPRCGSMRGIAVSATRAKNALASPAPRAASTVRVRSSSPEYVGVPRA